MPRFRFVYATMLGLVSCIVTPALSPAFANPRPESVPPVVGDASAALQQVLNVAGPGGVVRLTASASYRVCTGLTLPKGLKEFDGAGATITVGGCPAAPDNVILLRSNASGVTVRNITLDLAGSKARGILALADENSLAGQNWPQVMTGVIIDSVTIARVGYKGIEFVARQGSVRDVAITNNRIGFAGPTARKTDGGKVGISVTASQSRAPSENWERFLATGDVGHGPYQASHFTIRGNRIHGGYYGIGLDSVTDSTIENNMSFWNTRNISMQNHSDRNRVADNHLHDARSAAIHVAYNSSGNIVDGNTIVTGRGEAEGLMQAYQGSLDNTFSGNTVLNYGAGDTRAKWAMYTATGSHGTRFTGNVVSGPYKRALTAVESIWDGASAHPHQHGYMSAHRVQKPGDKNSSVDYVGGSGSLDGVSIDANLLHQTSSAPVGFVGADVSANETYCPQGCTGDITGMRFTDNTVLGSAPAQVTLHRGKAGVLPEPSIDLVSDPNEQPGLVARRERGGRITEFAVRSHTIAADAHDLRLLGHDRLTGIGNSGNNTILGNTAVNDLQGGEGDDTLAGGRGGDTLTGGSGGDRFVVDTPPNREPGQPSEVDDLKDFTKTSKKGEKSDTIVLPTALFGALPNGFFASSAQARTPDTRIYQQGRHVFYDADGSGALFAPVGIVTVPAGVTLAATDFAQA